MTTERQLTKAQLIEIAWQEGQEKPEVTTSEKSPSPLTVQFNPASLKVTFSNQVESGGDTSSSLQFVGRGDSKLAVELIFDVSGKDASNREDVRRMTDQVAFFMKTQKETQTNDEGEDETRYKVPGVRFQWGTFLFDGVMVSMDETLELWSEDGRPLRAAVSISLSQPGINFDFQENPNATGAPGTGKPAGTTPMTATPAGASLQGMVAGAGLSADWKAVASANGIENPRNLAAGSLVNLQVGAAARAGPGADLQGGASLRPGGRGTSASVRLS
jgi:hypothetical protein